MKKCLIITFTAVLTLAACQEFSVIEAFKLSNESSSSVNDTSDALTLNLEKVRINQGDTINLIPGGGTPPYSYQTAALDLIYDGSGPELGSFSENSFTASDPVGKINIFLSDSAGRQISEPLIIKPPKPNNLNISTNSTSITLTWEGVNQEMITGYELTRTSSTGGEHTFDVIAKSIRTYTDHANDEPGLVPGTKYTYTVRSLANSYLSFASNEASSTF